MVVIAPSVSAFYVSICIYTYIFLSFLFFSLVLVFLGGRGGYIYFFCFFSLLNFRHSSLATRKDLYRFLFLGGGKRGGREIHTGVLKKV